MLDTQKKMAETITETAKKFTSTEAASEVMENSKEFFNTWLNNKSEKGNAHSKNGNTSEKHTAEKGKSVNDTMENWKSFYENFSKTQTESINNAVKSTTDLYNKWFSGLGTSNFGAANPFMQNANPFMANANSFNTWNTQFTDMYQNMMNNFKNQGDTKNAFEGMFGNMQSYMKFYEMMSPMLKAMQNNTYSKDQFSKYFTPDAYKGFMDSFFGFLPDNGKGMMTDGMGKFFETMQSMNNPAMDMFKNMNINNDWQKFVPKGNQMFAEATNNYNKMQESLKTAFGPYGKLFSSNEQSNSSEAISSIFDMMNRLQISNAHMQFLTYTTGIKAMEAMNKSVAEKVKEGKTFENMEDLFKEYLNNSDKYFVELFESDEFSKAQAENSSLSLKLKHTVNGQMEKMFVNMPLVPRSEMEELYKTVYELKKRIRTLEKEVDVTPEPKATKSAATHKATTTAPKATAARKATASRKKSRR